MAFDTFPYNSHVVHRFDDVSADFPSNGLAVADITIIGIKGTGTTDITIEVTFDSKKEINDGTADWMVYDTVTAGNTYYKEFDPGPKGVRLSGGSGEKAWIKS